MVDEPRRNPDASWESIGPTPGANPAENYDRFFVPHIGAPLAADLMETAALQPGERVLDVACGTGVVTLLAAAAVGATGSVAGLDVNPAMLAVARTKSPDIPIQWHESSAETIPLEGESVDVVLCQLGLQFVPDKARALGEMQRVLAASGRIVLNLPGAMPPPFAVLHPAVKQHLGPEAAGFLGSVFSLHDPAQIRSLLEAAEFRDVSVVQGSTELSLPAPAVFLWQYLSSTPMAAAVAQASDDARVELEQEVVEKWQDYVVGDGMAYQQDVVTATASK